MGESQFVNIINSFNQLDGLADIILLDTGAGISKDVSNFLLAADEIIIVTTPEPHAITDAYAITKVMNKLGSQARQMLIVNRAENQPEADIVANKLSSVVSQYLKRDIDYIGYVQEDPLIRRSLKQQTPLLLLSPESQPARNIEAIANRLLDKPVNNPAGITGFITKMFSLFKK
jgi:flagellar biosynthesis protein FlhG